MINVNALLVSTRLDRELSRHEAARQIGVSEGALRHWETVDGSRASDRFWRRLATWLGVPTEEVATWFSRPSSIEDDDVPTVHE